MDLDLFHIFSVVFKNSFQNFAAAWIAEISVWEMMVSWFPIRYSNIAENLYTL